MRRVLTSGLVVVGVALMIVGYFLSAPWGGESVANSDPVFPYAPALFVIGVIAAFTAAVVYELVPDRRQ